MNTATTLHSNAAIAARLKTLPRSAQAKYEHLRRIEQRARATADGLYEAVQRARETRDEAVIQLGRFDRVQPPAFEYRDDPATGRRTRVAVEFPERAAIADRIEAAKTELNRLQAEQGAVHPGFSLSAIDDWLGTQSRSAKVVDARIPVKLARGETLATRLEGNRETQARMTDELARVRNAPRTVAEAKASMRQQVAALAAEGAPDVWGLFRGGDIRWPSEQLLARAFGGEEVAIATTVNNATALAVWAHRDAIIAALEAAIEHCGNGRDALSAADQTARIAECEAALLQLQREAEAIIERLEGDGVAVRRTCTDPLVLLGIEPV